MTCPHSLHGSPDRCSQCLGYPAKRVANVGPIVTIDAQPTERVLDREANARSYYARRRRKR